MKKSLFAVAAIVAALNVHAEGITLSEASLVYAQDFDTLASTTSTTSAILPSGWMLLETGTAADATYAVGTGSSNSGNTYSFGLAGSTERALGGLLSGSLTPVFGASFVNQSTRAVLQVDIRYTGEQWRLGTTGRAVPDRLDFQYSTDATSLTTGTWADANALDFIAPTTVGTVGALNGNAAANSAAVSGTLAGLSLAPTQTLWIRWSDFNASGADDGLAVDNFSLTATLAPVPEPDAAALMLAGLATLGFLVRRRRA